MFTLKTLLHIVIRYKTQEFYVKPCEYIYTGETVKLPVALNFPRRILKSDVFELLRKTKTKRLIFNKMS